MGRGGYSGGSTIIGPWSQGWFSRPKSQPVSTPAEKAARKTAKSVKKPNAELGSKPAKVAKSAKEPLMKKENRAAHDRQEAFLRKTTVQNAPVPAKTKKRPKNEIKKTTPLDAVSPVRPPKPNKLQTLAKFRSYDEYVRSLVAKPELAKQHGLTGTAIVKKKR